MHLAFVNGPRRPSFTKRRRGAAGRGFQRRTGLWQKGFSSPPPIVGQPPRLLRSSQEHVRRQIREGKLKARRLGTRSWRIDPEDYKAFIDGQVVAPAPDPDGSA